MSGAEVARRRFVGRRLAFAALVVFAASVPLEGLGHIGALGSASRAAGLLAAAAAVAAHVVDLPIRRAERTFFLMVTFVLWVVLSYFWSSDPDRTFSRILTYLQLVGLAWILWQQLRDSECCRWLMRGYVAGAAVACLYTTLTRNPHETGPRYSVGNPNDFSVIVVVAVVMAFHLLVTTPSRKLKLAYAAFIALGAVAVFLTASRTGVITLGAASAVAAIDRRFLTPARLAGVVVLVVVASFSVLQTASDQQLERIGTIGTAAETGFNQRTTQWELSFETFSRHPIKGIGANAFRAEAEEQTGLARVAHNSFLGVAADLGIVGVTLLLLTLAAGYVQLVSLPTRLRQTWIAIVVAWLLGANTLTWEHRKITWFLLFLAVAEAHAARAERASSTGASSAPATARSAAPSAAAPAH